MHLLHVPVSGICPEGISESAFVTDILSTYRNYYKEIGFNDPWVGYFIVDGETVVGTCGFTGAPKENRVEIAYYTFKPFEGRGIASFACRQLIDMVKRDHPSVTVTAKTAPGDNASTSILKRNGFRKTGVVQDDGIGDAWAWVLEVIPDG